MNSQTNEEIEMLISILTKKQIPADTKKFEVETFGIKGFNSKDLTRYRQTYKTRFKENGIWYAETSELLERIKKANKGTLRKIKDEITILMNYNRITNLKDLKKIDKSKNELVYDGNIIRYVIDDNDVWYVGKDIAKLLEYEDTKKALSNNIKDKYKKLSNDIKNTNGEGEQKSPQKNTLENKTILINQFGLTQLIMNSKKHEAVEFQEWVIEEVIPTLMTKGKYSVADSIKVPELFINMQEFYDKSVVYVFHVTENIYKFGISDAFEKRKKDHEKTFPSCKLVYIKSVKDFKSAKLVEKSIKKYASVNHTRIYLNRETNEFFNSRKIKDHASSKYSIEFFETNDKFTLDKVKNAIDTEADKYATKNKDNKTLIKTLFDSFNSEDCDKLLNKMNSYVELGNNIIKIHDKVDDILKNKEKQQSMINQFKRPSNNQQTKPEKTILKYVPKPSTLPENKTVKKSDKKVIKTRTATYEPTNQKDLFIKDGKYVFRRGNKRVENVPAYKCLDCDIYILKENGRCMDCTKRYEFITNKQGSKRPPPEILAQEMREAKSFVELAAKYKTSDNSIRKWIKCYKKYCPEIDIPSRPQGK